MKVILNKSVETVGSVGEVIEVKTGFARNYLLPQGLACLATPGNIKTIEKQRSKEIQVEKEHRAVAEVLSKKIRDIVLTIEKNAGEDDKLFGSVSPTEIQEALALQGVETERKHVLMKKPIRAIGSHEVDIRCYGNIKAPLRILVTRRKQ